MDLKSEKCKIKPGKVLLQILVLMQFISFHWVDTSDLMSNHFQPGKLFAVRNTPSRPFLISPLNNLVSPFHQTFPTFTRPYSGVNREVSKSQLKPFIILVPIIPFNLLSSIYWGHPATGSKDKSCKEVEPAGPGTQGEALPSGTQVEAAVPEAQVETAGPGAQGEALVSGTQVEVAVPGAQVETAGPGAQGEALASGTQVETAGPGTQGEASPSGTQVEAAPSGTQVEATASVGQGEDTENEKTESQLKDSGSQKNTCKYFNEVGSCLVKDECLRTGGTLTVYCKDFSKFCCTFKHSCGKETNSISSYFRNLNYPISTLMSSECKYTVRKAHSNVCGVRVTLKSLAMPANIGYCEDTSLEVVSSGSGKNYEPLCGEQSGEIYDVEFGSSDQIDLRVSSSRSLRIRWNIHVLQYSCNEFTTSVIWPQTGSPPSGPDSPAGPPPSGIAVQSPPEELFQPGPPGPVGPPGEAEPIIEHGTYQCGLSAVRSKRPSLNARQHGQLPASSTRRRCTESMLGGECETKGVIRNPLLKSLEWGVPVPVESLFYRHAGVYLVDGRITFGEKTQPHEYPWAVAMYSNGRFHCGATLISDRHILTAAHCVIKKRNFPSALQLSLGDWDINSHTDGNHLVGKVKKVVTHPGYSTVTLKYDVAVLTMKEGITVSKDVMPICLPNSDIPLDDRLVTVAGWGRDEDNKLQSVLMEHSAVVVTNSVCDDRWVEKGAPKGIIASTMMCMDPQSGDSCKGDSGGPAFMEDPSNSGNFVQVGIVSFGSASCTDRRLPGVYTRVGTVTDWIRQQMV